MNSGEQAPLSQILHDRHATIAAAWFAAIARTSFVPFSAIQVCQYITSWTEQIIMLLLGEPLDRDNARAIGKELAGLHYVQPEALGRTQEVLGRHLVDHLGTRK